MNFNTNTNTNTNMDFGEQFYNPEKDLNQKYLDEIHMHKIMRGRKCLIIVQGLVFPSDTEAREFITKISSKHGTGGSYKMNLEYDDKKKIFIFNGDKRDEIRDMLVQDYGKDEEFIKYHG